MGGSIRGKEGKRPNVTGSGTTKINSPFDFEYENIGAGLAKLAWIAAPVPIGPAVTPRLPPTVRFPPMENALTASSELSTTTKSVMSAPIWRPQPRPPVAMQEGADHDPSGRRAITSPDPAFPEKTKPALRTWKMARPTTVLLVYKEIKMSIFQTRAKLARIRLTSCPLQNGFWYRIQCRIWMVGIS